MNGDNSVVRNEVGLWNGGAAVTVAVSPFAAGRFRKSPLVMRVVLFSYLALGLAGFVAALVMDPVNAERHRFLAIIGFAVSWVLAAVLKRVFLGRAVDEVSDELAARLGQSGEFRRAVRSVLLGTPWSRHRLSRGRHKEPRFEDIMVLFRSGDHTVMSMARDFSSVSIIPPERVAT